MFRFKCACCGEWHEGMPSFDAAAPLAYHDIPEQERDTRCELSSDACLVDGQYFFIRGCLEIPVHGTADPFVWGVWVSMSEASFIQFAECFETEKRAHVGPFFGWLNASLPVYPNTANLKTLVHLRDDGIRPSIELEPTDHPLAIEQRNGIDADRVAEIYAYFERQQGRSF